MPVIILSNLKGGVAKTTSAVAIAECLATLGHRTLLIDADHQCMAGELLLGETRQLHCERNRRTLHDLLAAMLELDFDPARFPGFIADGASNIAGGMKNLSVMPCSMRVDDFSTNMAKARRGHKSNDEFLQALGKGRKLLKTWLNANFDYTIIDCPPSLAIQVQVLFPVADGYVIPSIPDRLSVRGSLYLLERIRHKGWGTPPIGTLWSLYRSQAVIHTRIIAATAKRTAPYDKLPKPFDTVIPNAAAIAESTEPGQNPTTFRNKYTTEFGRKFEAICTEIIARTKALPAATPRGQTAESAPDLEPLPALTHTGEATG